MRRTTNIGAGHGLHAYGLLWYFRRHERKENDVATTISPKVLVSSTVKDLVAGSGIRFEDRGLRELKGIPGSWQLYAVDRSSVA